MRARGPHLQEERLFDFYLAARDGEVLDPPVAEHLADCVDCGARYADLTSFMDTLSVEAAAETDAIFSPERLRQQRAQIGRRIEYLGHSARVISFPDRSGGHRFSASTHRSVRRLVAAAAAAGLFVGVGTGLLLDREANRSHVRHAGLQATAGLQAPTGLQATTVQTVFAPSNSDVEPDVVELVRPESDRDFLSELELAGERPRIRELSAVDALTPHVREVNLR